MREERASRRVRGERVLVTLDAFRQAYAEAMDIDDDGGGSQNRNEGRDSGFIAPRATGGSGRQFGPFQQIGQIA